MISFAFLLKGSLSPSNNENKVDKDLYCTLERLVLIRFIQRNQGHRYSVMHDFSSNVNKVNKAVAKVRTIGDRLPFNQSASHDCGMPSNTYPIILIGYPQNKVQSKNSFSINKRLVRGFTVCLCKVAVSQCKVSLFDKFCKRNSNF